MRVLHVSTFDTFGAARAMLRWHSGLNEAGVESRVLCFQKSVDASDIFSPSSSPDRTEAIKSQATQERWIDQCRTRFSDNFFSQPFYADPLIGEKLVDWAEVLHIHWISRSLNISHLAHWARKGKPLVLTPHDLWTVTGGCHYSAGCKKYRERCQSCPMVHEESQHLIEIAHRFKRAVFSESVAALICPSNWIRNEIVQCPGFETIQSLVIPYAWESEQFWPEKKVTARSAFGVPTDRNWLLFVAENLNETRKGLRDFLQLMKDAEQRLRAAGKENAFGVLIAGRTEAIRETDFGVPVVKLGFLANASDLRKAYSAADLFVYTGLEDNLPNVIIEALACGTPFLGYATGGAVDLVRPGNNGKLVESGDIQALTSALVDLLLNPARIKELAAGARKSIEINFDNQKIIRNLLSAYDAAVSNAKAKVLDFSVVKEAAEYEAFALRALVDRMESAEKRHSFELGSLHEILDRSFREIDAIFSVAPAELQRRYTAIAKERKRGEPDKDQPSIEEKWKEMSTKTYLLKEFFGWKPGEP
jgi:glycosyltransferase involved in cell wall biosynthesis